MTFDILADVLVHIQHRWQLVFEICSKCRRCERPSLSVIELRRPEDRDSFGNAPTVLNVKGDVSSLFVFGRYVGLADIAAKPVPDDLPEEIAAAFKEGARCAAIGCYNAAGAMFRLCLDLATKGLLPPLETEGGPDKQARRNLAPRLRWLFDNQRLPNELRDLSDAVKANGDDGAHEGVLKLADAEDIYDFAFALLGRLYTDPARIAAAEQRRLARREPGR